MNRQNCFVVALIVALPLVFGAAVAAQNPVAPESSHWTPERLADGQPNISGMWNNSNAMFTPLELPEGLAGQEFSADELQVRAEARASVVSIHRSCNRVSSPRSTFTRSPPSGSMP